MTIIEEVDAYVIAEEARHFGRPEINRYAAVTGRIEHCCINCGRSIDHVLQDRCGKPDCDFRAAVGLHQDERGINS